MRIVLAPDSFKESMSASRAAQCAARGIRSVFPDALCVEAPISDGGEGLLDVLAPALELEIITIEVPDANGRMRHASYGVNPQTGRAVVEVAQAIGLEHIAPAERNILSASSAGVGYLLRHAHDNGARDILVGLGGSATSDGGIGAFLALGGKINTDEGQINTFYAPDVPRLTHLELPPLDGWEDTRITVACDVSNPLTGLNGAAHIFAPQKGASPQDVVILDEALVSWGRALEDATHRTVVDTPGAGAAGGLGAFFMAIFGAQLQPGIEMVLDAIDFDTLVTDADLVITGEGKMDAQTRQGKAPWGVVQRAHQKNIPVLAVCGKRSDDAVELIGQDGFIDIIQISDPSLPLAQSLIEGPERIASTCGDAVRKIFAQTVSGTEVTGAERE